MDPHHPHDDRSDAFNSDQHIPESMNEAIPTPAAPPSSDPIRPLPYTFQHAATAAATTTDSTTSSFNGGGGGEGGAGLQTSAPPLSHFASAITLPSTLRSHQGYSGAGHGQYGGVASAAAGYHPLPSQQQHYHQRHHHHHHFHQEYDIAGVNVMKIDYEGLDAFVEEALLNESGFQQKESDAMIDPEALQDSKDFGTSSSYSGGGGLERAHSTGSASVFGSAFRRKSARKASYYSERAPRPPLEEQSRYTFFTKTTGLLQAPTLPHIVTQAAMMGIVQPDGPLVFSDLLKDGCFWIDILDPSDTDMQMLSKHFHVHPLTIEDISTEEVREKYEVFKNYYFVCFRTFDQDYNSGSYLQPASMYSVVLRDGIITFHFRPTIHHINVLRRLEQFHSHITLTPDWINYALLDDITDSFASPIQTIEYEVDSIDELVLLLRENETSDMLRRIGSCRKNVMAISRLLMNKADVVRGLMKRFDERFALATAAIATSKDPHVHAGPAGGVVPLSALVPIAPSLSPAPASTIAPSDSAADIAGTAGSPTQTATARTSVSEQSTDASTGMPTVTPIPASGAPSFIQQQPQQPQPQQQQHDHHHHQQQPHRDGEILLYLGDILDHVLTMLQSLNSYEKILSRSHSNYLAQISLEINQLSNKTNEVVGTLTFFASLIVPMTFVAGLWGMNVHVPGQPGNEGESLNWWWGLCGFMALYCIVAIIFGKRYGLI
ncbi:magnesium transporter [Entomortierella parvispora]|uniref:Magnesium transporter n=1 Tax=Entomortierella parvispora TaxID=205924 RepID=A0A9P3H557_9FUNG|nr:magnesium transporter [Entomortierella parvispora]